MRPKSMLRRGAPRPAPRPSACGACLQRGSPVALAQGLLPSWYGSGLGLVPCVVTASPRSGHHVPLPFRPDPCRCSCVPVQGPLTSHWRCRARAPSLLRLGTPVPPSARRCSTRARPGPGPR
ncbi:hypothetical protein NDU88_001919 [Pleurodeles waltl]|uniref:Uncharacterized protein n=1 Tax=Pleurodeles waltl TaxID=8319 RepID=A0AAV7KT68_PLEWA|nr:hypothetical protein NDU88_001919 [Pleurodeles waltl]